MGAAYTGGFDAHTHLDFPAFDGDREEVCARARSAGVGGWAVVGADPAHWERVIHTAEHTGGVALVGLHPWWVGRGGELDALASLPEASGIGEIGLDQRHGELGPQVGALRIQLGVARARDVPVALHCVRAWPELLRLLQDDGLPGAGGMVHGWAGLPWLLEAYLELGLHISIGPRVLRPTAKKDRDAARRIPAERLLLETDAPESPLRGQRRGEPADLVEVARAVAELRGEEPGEVLARTGANARALFNVRAPTG